LTDLLFLIILQDNKAIRICRSELFSSYLKKTKITINRSGNFYLLILMIHHIEMNLSVNIVWLFYILFQLFGKFLIIFIYLLLLFLLLFSILFLFRWLKKIWYFKLFFIFIIAIIVIFLVFFFTNFYFWCLLLFWCVVRLNNLILINIFFNNIFKFLNFNLNFYFINFNSYMTFNNLKWWKADIIRTYSGLYKSSNNILYSFLWLIIIYRYICIALRQ